MKLVIPSNRYGASIWAEMVIGVDFDNTIITYDRLIQRLAWERELIGTEVPCNKRCIRDAIRRRPGGETEWRRLQAMVYGPLIGEAELIEGVDQFFESCRHRGIKVYVVSHKTNLAAADETGTSLREAALDWMSGHGFFMPERFGLRRQDVYFEDTREWKIERIVRLGCTHFIDDLVETFQEPSWPRHVKKVLYAPHSCEPTGPGIAVYSSWKAINEHLFSFCC